MIHALTALLGRLRARLFEPGGIRLGRYLLVALAIRIPAVLLSRGYEFIDHQFQYVDPAYHLGLGGSWWRPYDYNLGHRSWAYPWLLGWIFRGIDALGIREAGAMMAVTRLVHALISLLPVAAFWNLVTRWRGLTGQRPLLLFFAWHPFAVYAAVQPTGVTLAITLSLTAVFLFDGRRWCWPLLSGLLVGAAFCCRFQDAVFVVGLGAIGLLQRRWLATLVMGIGAAIGAVGQGLIDLVTWGRFFHSPLRYYEINIVAGHATEPTFGAESFYYYAVACAVLLVWVPPFLVSGWRALRDGWVRFPVLGSAAIAYLLFHNLFPRKRLRFVIPALILLGLVYAYGLLQQRVDEGRWRRWHRRAFFGLHAVLVVVLSVWYFHRGPVEAARELSRRSDFQNRLVLIDGQPEDVGGHFYLRRDDLEVFEVPRDGFGDWLEASDLPSPLYVMVPERPLGNDTRLTRSWRLEQVAATSDWPRLRSQNDRFVYRAERIAR